MECIMQHDIVRSLAGHDAGKLFLVIETRAGRVLLANGKTRKLQKPKFKNQKHLELVSRGMSQPAESIGISIISNKEITRLLASTLACPSKKA